MYRRDLTRLVQEIEAFPATETLWVARPGVANPAGTLALHLDGNLREYVGRQLGGVAYVRQRALEFSLRGVEKSEIVARLESLRELIPGVIAGLDEAALGEPFPEPMQGWPVTKLEALVHLHGHFNYHLGQIDFLRRVLTGREALELAQLT
jgi:hypothetical protein